ncbi:hypothetical protein BT69DRAFT_1346778 [Atractiella rhizophila]|nr:hypothetical protein BT69DRAFT_1346778 [Atractiella rhizophila]
MSTNNNLDTDEQFVRQKKISQPSDSRRAGKKKEEKCEMSQEPKQKKGIGWERRDGVPILGSRRVRKVLLAAAFPEFYTTEEVDILHSLLDEERTARYNFFGDTNVTPDRNRLMWRYRAGQFESIRWIGSRDVDPYCLSPWWAGGIIFGLLHEMPREYLEHVGAYMQVKRAINIMNRLANEPKFV